MVYFIILFLAYLIAAAVGAGSEFTLFIIFLALAVVALRRWNEGRKEEERWQQLNARITGVELNQQQLRKSFQEVISTGLNPASPGAEPHTQPVPQTAPAATVERPVEGLPRPVTALPAPIEAPPPSERPA